MRNKISILALALGSIFTITACKQFDEINTSPTQADVSKIQPEYFLNASILGAQMNPDTAERSFVLYWQGAGHTVNSFSAALQDGSTDDGWTSAYYNAVSGWLKNATFAINVAQEKIANGTATASANNVIQVARIWRAYLMSEMSDNFGSIPVDAFKGENPTFNSTSDVYHFMLAELKDAVSKIDPTVDNSTISQQDPAYGYNWNKWIKYGNSMRMRLAMRLSEVEPATAKSEFEDAVKGGNFIATSADNFKVAEHDRNSWDDLTAVMSRTWDPQLMDPAINNIYLGLGGVKSADQLPVDFGATTGANIAANIKPDGYIGVKYPDQFTTMTNDPSSGYWLDGMPNKIDPRAYKSFFIPGNISDPSFPPFYATRKTSATLQFADNTTKTVEAKYTWNALIGGDWGDKSGRNGLISTGKLPAVANQFRGPVGTQTYRIFFGSWETYFLMAEAALRGWAVPMSDEAAYNKGIQESFAYFGVSQFYNDYINSTDYNRNGTSVKYSDTTEPGATHMMNYVDGKTGTPGTVTVNYPVNTIYKGGNVRNDKLTKIITQKFISNVIWLPLENWNDQRRLGLPFFPNQAVENPIPTLPALTASNYMSNAVNFFPQRLNYPSSFRNNDPDNYKKAVQLLNGGTDADNVFTPLWWAKH